MLAAFFFATQRTTLLALMRSANRVRKCLLFGADQTYGGRRETDAIDPTAT